MASIGANWADETWDIASWSATAWSQDESAASSDYDAFVAINFAITPAIDTAIFPI
jgi:hypothetical protein